MRVGVRVPARPAHSARACAGLVAAADALSHVSGEGVGVRRSGVTRLAAAAAVARCAVTDVLSVVDALAECPAVLAPADDSWRCPPTTDKASVVAALESLREAASSLSTLCTEVGGECGRVSPLDAVVDAPALAPPAALAWQHSLLPRLEDAATLCAAAAASAGPSAVGRLSADARGLVLAALGDVRAVLGGAGDAGALTAAGLAPALTAAVERVLVAVQTAVAAVGSNDAVTTAADTAAAPAAAAATSTDCEDEVDSVVTDIIPDNGVCFEPLCGVLFLLLPTHTLPLLRAALLTTVLGGASIRGVSDAVVSVLSAVSGASLSQHEAALCADLRGLLLPYVAFAVDAIDVFSQHALV